MSKIVKINANTIFITAMVSLNPFNNDKIWAPILIIAMLSLNPFYNDKIWAPQLFDLVRCQIKKELYLPIRTSVWELMQVLGGKISVTFIDTKKISLLSKNIVRYGCYFRTIYIESWNDKFVVGSIHLHIK